MEEVSEVAEGDAGVVLRKYPDVVLDNALLEHVPVLVLREDVLERSTKHDNNLCFTWKS